MNNSGFEVFYNPHIKKDLKVFNSKEKDTFFVIINNIIKKDPFKGKKLKGKYLGLYRFRFGNHRIIYILDFLNRIIYILRVSHIKDAYDNLNFLK
jgi:mRNA interferase RelE/StbE